MAERESRKISERTRRKQINRARTGQTHGGRRCFGYKTGNMQVNEAEAFILREMGSRLLAGYSFKEIAYWANEQGYKTAEGKMWYSVTIRNSLRRVRALMARRSVIILVGRYGLSITVECKATHSENAAAVAW
jgi:DNA invertase Pin-like site-specific DNA recombinase